MSGEHVLWPLVPLEADERHDGEVRLARGNKSPMQCVGLGARSRLRRTLIVLELHAAKRVGARHDRRAEAMDCIPCTGHPDHAQGGLAEPALNSDAHLQGFVELIYPSRRK